MQLLGKAYGWRPLHLSGLCGDLGFQLADDACVKDAVYLHFGEKKPWLDDGINTQLWRPYAANGRRAAEGRLRLPFVQRFGSLGAV